MNPTSGREDEWLRGHPARRFAWLSVAFLVLMTFSCAVEERLFKFLPNFHYYWTTAFVELTFFAGYALVSLAGDPQTQPPTAPRGPATPHTANGAFFTCVLCIALPTVQNTYSPPL